MKGTPYTEDRVEPNEDLWLDMGARLFKAIKPFALKKVKFLKILKFVGHKSKFDVRYVVSEYKLKKQTKVDAKSKK